MAAHPAPAGDPVAATDEDGILRGDPGPAGITGPTAQEMFGWRRNLLSVWSAEPEDQGATERGVTFLEEGLSRLGIRPAAYHVRCSLSLCRARFRFRAINELHRMREIKPPSGLEVMTTMPQRINDDLVDLSIYWPQDGVSLQDLALQNRGDAGDPWAGR